ncbi:MAG: succinylglutamate desuccinylase/aspartoacylase family protein [Chthoniobacterales bacterium]
MSASDRSSIIDFLKPLDEVCERSSLLRKEVAGRFQIGAETFEVPRYHFTSLRKTDYRLGIFAVIHGDEVAGGRALIDFSSWLVESEALLEGYEIMLYPLCNPSGFLMGTRHSFSGKDLNREFWHDSAEPEVRILERDLQQFHFDGLVSLHSDDTSQGVYGFVRGATLAEALLEPALAAAEKILPRNLSRNIDGFNAYNGIIYDGYPGILSSRQIKPQPFEIIFETPGLDDESKQAEVSNIALQTILLRYREFISYASNI